MMTIHTSPTKVAEDERGAFICDVPDFSTFWSDIESRVTSVVELLRPPAGQREPFVIDPIKKFAWQCFLAPASNEHHDSDVTGLVRHTLDVVLQLLSNPQVENKSYEDRLAYFIVALLHDIGRMWELRITNIPTNGGPTETWRPQFYNMVKWLTTHEITRVRIAFKKPTSPGISHRSSEAIGLLYLSSIFPAAVITQCGRRRTNSIIWSLTRQVTTARYDYFTLFKQADIAACRAARGATTSSEHILSVIQSTIALSKNDVRPNQPGGEVFVSPSHTLVVVPPDGSRATVWSAIMEMYRSESLNPRRLKPLEFVQRVLGSAVFKAPGSPDGLFDVVTPMGVRRCLAFVNDSLWSSFPVSAVLPPRSVSVRLTIKGQDDAKVDQLGFADEVVQQVGTTSHSLADGHGGTSPRSVQSVATSTPTQTPPALEPRGEDTPFPANSVESTLPTRHLTTDDMAGIIKAFLKLNLDIGGTDTASLTCLVGKSVTPALQAEVLFRIGAILNSTNKPQEQAHGRVPKQFQF